MIKKQIKDVHAKIQLGEKVKRLRITDDTKLEHFLKLISDSFQKQVTVLSHSITYLDHEKSIIDIVNQKDFEEALYNSTENQKLELKVFITQQQQIFEMETEKEEKEKVKEHKIEEKTEEKTKTFNYSLHPELETLIQRLQEKSKTFNYSDPENQKVLQSDLISVEILKEKYHPGKGFGHKIALRLSEFIKLSPASIRPKMKNLYRNHISITKGDDIDNKKRQLIEEIKKDVTEQVSKKITKDGMTLESNDPSYEQYYEIAEEKQWKFVISSSISKLINEIIGLIKEKSVVDHLVKMNSPSTNSEINDFLKSIYHFWPNQNKERLINMFNKTDEINDEDDVIEVSINKRKSEELTTSPNKKKKEEKTVTKDKPEQITEEDKEVSKTVKKSKNTEKTTSTPLENIHEQSTSLFRPTRQIGSFQVSPRLSPIIQVRPFPNPDTPKAKKKKPQNPEK